MTSSFSKCWLKTNRVQFILLALLFAFFPGPAMAEDASQIYTYISPAVISVTAGQQVVGSGFVVNPDGSIITCAHVVEGISQLEVKFGDDYKAAAKVVHRDKGLDLALLQTEATNLPAVRFTLEPVKSGNEVFALGSPLGMESTFSKGIVGNPARKVDKQLYIQASISVNPGNSGGPLLNSSGQVVGVISMKVKDAEGMAFAIPSLRVVDYLQEQGVTVELVGREAHSPANKVDPKKAIPSTGKPNSTLFWPAILVIITGVVIISIAFIGVWYRRQNYGNVLPDELASEPNIEFTNRSAVKNSTNEPLEDIDIDFK